MIIDWTIDNSLPNALRRMIRNYFVLLTFYNIEMRERQRNIITINRLVKERKTNLRVLSLLARSSTVLFC